MTVYTKVNKEQGALQGLFTDFTWRAHGTPALQYG